MLYSTISNVNLHPEIKGMPLRHRDCGWVCPASHYLKIHHLLRRSEFDLMRLVLMYFGEFSVTTELESPSLRESASKLDVNEHGLQCVRQKLHEVL